MKDIKGFCKIFDISVPDYNHFDYYLGQLSKLPKYKDIKELSYLYESAENDIGDLFQYRVDKSNEIISFLENTRAYNDLTFDNLIKDYPISKSFQYEENKKYLSIDIRKANWSILKKYDPPFDNELPDTYEDLLDKFGMPDVFKRSKSLRQFIFGNINPKKQAKVQRVVIQELIEKIEHFGKSILNIECIKNDEIIYSYTDISYLRNSILPLIDMSIFKIKLFSIKKLEDFRVDFITDEFDNFLYKEMVGCNGNKFFLLLKKYIFEEPYEIRDLYFKIDGDIAIWRIDDLKCSL